MLGEEGGIADSTDVKIKVFLHNISFFHLGGGGVEGEGGKGDANSHLSALWIMALLRIL